MDSLAELARRLDNLIRLGTIAEVDHAAARCRVKSGRLLTTWLPWIALRAGGTLDWNPPTVGEQCLLFSPSGETAQALVLTGLYSDAHRAPEKSPDLHRRQYPDGAIIDYDHATHALDATLPGGATVMLQATGGVTIEGDVTVDGKLKVTGDAEIEGTARAAIDVLGADKSLVKHLHLGNLGVPTSPPQ
ncbi:phage baseplate assembly protein V [Metapseudomonas furukawaii]|jgi:phage baseplate assembly protein V|uniref:Baseplate assembly protein V n=1 Tax=Metapseudomonas furukawaii TaxID=1149133 RepID=A0AAD1C1K8_METFU|nr:phage baseplate assembly protein V [Pseudomonas furukawaii]ELS26654.1 Phage baseplate assembly protein V [Pseudomonas furukawaii]BAU74388.1 baseplate assembly protein V [Pseudomonas furukawaii]